MANKKSGEQKKKLSKANILKKGKKRWFNIKAPEIYNSIEFGQTTAFEPNEIIGRIINVPLKELTGSFKDSSSNVYLRIKQVRGETAETEQILYCLQNAYIGRIDRKAKDRIITIAKGITKDKSKISIKIYSLLTTKVARNVRSEIHNRILANGEEFITKRNSEDLFSGMAIKTLASNLRKDVKNIYPANIIIWKIKKE